MARFFHLSRTVRNAGISILVVLGVILLLKEAREVFVPFVLAGLLFYALDPVVDWLQSVRIPRAIGAAVVLLVVLGASGWTVYAVRDEALEVVENLPTAVRHLRSALRNGPGEPPSTMDKLQRAANEIDKNTAQAMPSTTAPAGVTRVQIEEPPLRASDFLWWGSVGIVAVVSESLMVLLLTYFLLLANDLFKRKLIKNFGTRLSEKRITVQILDQISTQIARFLLVQLATSLLVAVVTGFALWAIGLEHAAFWGVTAGVLNSIPYFGPMIVSGALGTVAFMQFGTPGMALAVAGTAIVITALEGWLLMPTLMGRAAQMNQVAVFASLIFWTWLWGVWGVLLAVPMMMMLKSVCDHVEDLKPIGDLLGE